MKNRLFRGLTGLLAALIICVCPSSAGAESSDNAVETFYFARLGASADQAKSYRIIETARGHIIRIELFYSCYIVLPAADDDMDALYALIDALKLAEWNSFDETDPDALDGESFSLSVAFSDGGAITASGSNRFPEGYADAAARIEAFFQKLMESYEIDVEQIIL